MISVSGNRTVTIASEKPGYFDIPVSLLIPISTIESPCTTLMINLRWVCPIPLSVRGAPVWLLKCTLGISWTSTRP